MGPACSIKRAYDPDNLFHRNQNIAPAEESRWSYPEPTWDRLRSIKRRYDPGNLFRLNQNVPPA